MQVLLTRWVPGWRVAASVVVALVAVCGCGGGRDTAADKPLQHPLEAAQRTQADPVGDLAVVKAQALKSAQNRKPSDLDAEALFLWAQDAYPQVFAPGALTQTAGNLVYRYYPASQTYLAVQGELVLAMGPSTTGKVVELGHLADFTCAVFPEICQPPVADAGLDQSVRTGTTVTLDGSLSHDPSGDTLTFSWSVVSQPVGSASALNAKDLSKPTLTVDRAGTYVFNLVVRDGRSDSAPSRVTITATASNAAPVARPGSDRTVPVGTLVTLDGSASSDADGDVLTYRWSLVSKPAASRAALVGAFSASPAFSVDVGGPYILALVVNDGRVDSSVVNVSVTGSVSNVAPVANAGQAQSVSTGNSVFLNGLASSDGDGDPITYAWTLTSRPAGSVAALLQATSASPLFVVDVAGSYVASLVVNDGKVSSAPATVSVTATTTGTGTGTGTGGIPPRTCCKVCSSGKACGDSCISSSKTCHVGAGCAC